MKPLIQLPKDKATLGRVIRAHVEREVEAQSVVRAMYGLACWYNMGYRRFDVFEPERDRLQAHYLDEDGNMEFQDNQLLYEMNEVMGVLGSMDIRPKVMRRGQTLNQIRQASISQILLDAASNTQELKETSETFNYLFTTLGMAGVYTWAENHPQIGLQMDTEVVHPVELLPFPSQGIHRTREQGFMRRRFVPESWLKERVGSRRYNEAEKTGRLVRHEVQIGTILEHGRSADIDTHVRNTAGHQAVTDNMILVELVELWVKGAVGTLGRYVAVSGDQVLEDRDFSGQNVQVPLKYAQFYQNGTFYGTGFFQMRFSLHRQSEKLTRSLFQNTTEQDRYPLLVLPSGTYNERTGFRDSGKGLHLLKYTSDPSNMDPISPMEIRPVNYGQVPGQVAQYADSKARAINPVPNLLQEKGRVDSAAGLQFLDEQGRRPLTLAMQGKAEVFGGVYKAAMERLTSLLTTVNRPIPVNDLTLDLAGAVIDFREETVDFRRNPLPSSERLDFGIKATGGSSSIAIKREAFEAYQLHQDLNRYVLHLLENGEEPSFYSGQEKAAYQQVVRNILTLFGDGETPGNIELHQSTVLPELQLAVLSAFMAGPVFGNAEVEVRQYFAQYQESLRMFAGFVLPTGVPNPDDAAIVSDASNRVAAATQGLRPRR